MKNAASLATPATEISRRETALLHVVDMEAIEDVLWSAKALIDRVFDDDDALPTDRALHWQLVRQLTSLQLECQRIRAWLDEMQFQSGQSALEFICSCMGDPAPRAPVPGKEAEILDAIHQSTPTWDEGEIHG